MFFNLSRSVVPPSKLEEDVLRAARETRPEYWRIETDEISLSFRSRDSLYCHQKRITIPSKGGLLIVQFEHSSELGIPTTINPTVGFQTENYVISREINGETERRSIGKQYFDKIEEIFEPYRVQRLREATVLLAEVGSNPGKFRWTRLTSVDGFLSSHDDFEIIAQKLSFIVGSSKSELYRVGCRLKKAHTVCQSAEGEAAERIYRDLSGQ